jgi:hypothetical protein
MEKAKNNWCHLFSWWELEKFLQAYCYMFQNWKDNDWKKWTKILFL